MRGILGGGGSPGKRALVCWSFAGCLLGGTGSLAASDLGNSSGPTAARAALEDRIPDLKRSREGARERLGDARCQVLLSDFASVDGRRLDEVLLASGRTARQQLDLLVFESGFGRPGCSRGQLAFTNVGSTVVSVCVWPFTLLPPAKQEAVLIHEMLHSLGLGENPPESVAITKRVLERCGR